MNGVFRGIRALAFRDRGSFLIDYANSLGGKYLAALVGAARSVLVPAILGPSGNGVWRILKLVDDFSRMGNLGTVSALTRQLPYFEGRDEPERADSARSTALTMSLVGGLITASGFAIAAWTMEDPAIRTAVFVFAVYNLIARVFLFYRTLFGAERRFGTRARLGVTSALLESTFVLLVAWLYGLTGLVWASALSLLVICLLFRRAYGRPTSLGLRRNDFVESVSVGFPIQMNGILGALLKSADKLLILAMLDVRSVGLFAAGSMVAVKLADIAYTIGMVASPRFSREYGKAADVAALRPLFMFAVSSVSVLFPPLCLIAYFGVDLLLTTLWIEYREGATAIKLQIATCLYTALYLSFAGFFAAIRKQGRIVALQVIVVVANLGGAYLLIRAGWGITGAAVATAVSLVTFSVAQLTLALVQLGSGRRMLLDLARVLTGPVVATVLIVGAEFWLRESAAGTVHATRSLLAGLVCLVAYSLVAGLVAHSTGMTRRLREAWREHRVDSLDGAGEEPPS